MAETKSEEKQKEERVIEIETERLKSFINHPFRVQADSQMLEPQESIKKYGILNPLIVRPRQDATYEIISGHRRKYAAEKLGYRKVPVIIRVLKDDDAVISMVDSNLQRERISPSEKAFAYKMKYEVIKRKTGRRKCGQVDHHLGKKSIEVIGEICGDSPKQVQRYIKITELIPELLEKVDDGTMGFTPAVEISFLKKNEQKDMLEAMEIAKEISNRMKSELGITVSIGVSYNKIFAKLGSDYKNPDAITTMYREEFRTKAWKLPASDLLYVGRSTEAKLKKLGIYTIGDLATCEEELRHSHLGKMGSVLWGFANGYDDSPVKRENTSAPIKSIGNSTTTPRDLETDTDVKIILYVLAESVAARLRENGFKCRVVEISIRDNDLYSFTRQHKIDHATNGTKEIAEEAYRIFQENYFWQKSIRSVGVRAADQVNDH